MLFYNQKRKKEKNIPTLRRRENSRFLWGEGKAEILVFENKKSAFCPLATPGGPTIQRCPEREKGAYCYAPCEEKKNNKKKKAKQVLFPQLKNPGPEGRFNSDLDKRKRRTVTFQLVEGETNRYVQPG